MTTSIVFDEERISNSIDRLRNLETKCGKDISLSDHPYNDSEWLTDLSSNFEALQRLRILKSRETGDTPYIPFFQQEFPDVSYITGRDIGNNIDFINYKYIEDYSMKRKAKVLKTYNKLPESQKSVYSRISKSKSGFRKLSNARIQALRNSQICNEYKYPPIKKLSTNSGIYGGKHELWFDPNVPYYSNI